MGVLDPYASTSLIGARWIRLPRPFAVGKPSPPLPSPPLPSPPLLPRVARPLTTHSERFESRKVGGGTSASPSLQFFAMLAGV